MSSALVIRREEERETWKSRLRDGSAEQPSALEELRNVLVRNLRRALAGYRTVTDAFVEDVVQETLVRVLERLEQFEGRSRFETWATSIGVHVAFSELRRKRWKDVSLAEVLAADTEAALRDAGPSGTSPATDPVRRELVEEMYCVIRNQLTEKQRTALLAELRGVPQEKIAQHLGSSRNAVYKLTHDARKSLRRGLEDAGFGRTDVRAAFSD